MRAHVRPCVRSYVRSCDGSGGYIYPTLLMRISETELLPEMPPKNPKKMIKAAGKVKAKGRKRKAPEADDDAPDIPQPPSPIEEPEEPAEEREETDKAAEADGRVYILVGKGPNNRATVVQRCKITCHTSSNSLMVAQHSHLSMRIILRPQKFVDYSCEYTQRCTMLVLTIVRPSAIERVAHGRL